MGIKGLNKLITEKSTNPDCIKTIKLEELQGSTIAIDTSIFMYKFKCSNRFGENFVQQISHFRKYNITPIYVFDGKPPEEKNFVLEKRRENKEKILKKIEELRNKLMNKNITSDERKKIKRDLAFTEKKCINITGEDVRNLKIIFDLFKVKYIEADNEADLICCDLYKKGIVDSCMSNDMDFLPSGAGFLIREYNLSDNIILYELDLILEGLNLSYDQFVDLCILCGCDYTNKIYRMGAITALDLILKEETIENILENYCGDNKKFKLPDNFDYMKARKLLKNEVEEVSYTIKNSEYDEKPNLDDIDKAELSRVHDTILSKFTWSQFYNRIKVICTV
jgi:flap endonuclease-1